MLNSAKLRERGSPPPRRTPKLSPDKINADFSVPYLDDKPDSPSSEWPPFATRFVLWYHFTTTLRFASIAVAFKVTFPNHETAMTEEDAGAIVQVMNQRLPLIRGKLNPDGQWPRPTGQGWIPCDHGMCCSALAAASSNRTSVMRNPTTRTRNDREMADMAAMLWEGSWEEILDCPRDHATVSRRQPSSNAQHHSTPSHLVNGQSSSVTTAPLPKFKWGFKAPALTAAAVNESTDKAFYVRGQGHSSSKKAASLPKQSSPRKSATSIKDPQPAAKAAPTLPSRRQPSSNAQHHGASSLPDDGRSSSAASTELLPKFKWGFRAPALASSAADESTDKAPHVQKQRPSPRKKAASLPKQSSPPKSATSITETELAAEATPIVPVGDQPSETSPRHHFWSAVRWPGGVQAPWFSLQLTIFLVYWFAVLDLCFELLARNLDNWGNTPWWMTLREVFLLYCAIVGAQHSILAALDVLRELLRHWCGIHVHPLDRPGLSDEAVGAHLILSGLTATVICSSLWLEARGARLLQAAVERIRP